MENPITIVTVILSVATLLGIVVQKGANYLMRKNDEKDIHIAKLVEDFKETVNHQRTLDRDMQEKGQAVLTDLSKNLTTNNEVNKQLISFLKNGK